MDEFQAKRLVETYADMILRISCSYLKQTYDAEDICQTVFLKYLSEERIFKSDIHEKAWIVRTTVNACKDHLKNAFFRRSVVLEAAADIPAAFSESASELLDALRTLPEKYRISLYLYYYEEYSVKEIASFLGKRENTVSAYLSRGRKRLRKYLSNELEGVAQHEGY